MVGMEERIRVSSVMVFPSRGTFTSQRTSTRFPLSSSAMSSMDFLASSSVGARTPKVSVKKEFRNRSEIRSLVYFHSSTNMPTIQHQHPISNSLEGAKAAALEAARARRAAEKTFILF